MTSAMKGSNRRPMTAGQLRLRRRADARRVEILRAAARVFRARGLAATGMREIALAADLSPGNLYHYFRGKDEILFFCQDQSLNRLIAALADARRTRGPIAVRLRRLATAHLRCLVDEVDGSAAHLEVDALPPTLRTAIIAKRDTYERGVRALIAGGIRRGELRRSDPTIATRAFLGALNWTVQWFRPEGPLSPERVAEVVSEYAVAGLVGPRLRGAVGETPGANHADDQRRVEPGRLRAVQDAARGPA